MTWDEFAEQLRDEGWTTDEIIEYLCDLQKYPEAVQSVLLSDN